MADISRSAETEQTQANSAPSGDSRPIYEIGYHLVPTLDEDAALLKASEIKAMLGDAEIIKEEMPKKMTLSYVVERPGAGRREKYGEAYFGFIVFAIDKEYIPNIENQLRANRSVLRHLLIQTVREEMLPARRTVFISDRLEGETLQKPVAEPEKLAEVSEDELDKSIEAIVL